jgi:hypothetical protein
MVWGTRKVCEEASHNRFASLSLPSQLPTNIENTLGYAPPSHARAIRRPTAIAFATISASSTSLVCKSELEVDFRLHLPCEILLAFQWCCPSLASLACKSETEVVFSRILLVPLPPPSPSLAK